MSDEQEQRNERQPVATQPSVWELIDALNFAHAESTRFCAELLKARELLRDAMNGNVYKLSIREFLEGK